MAAKSATAPLPSRASGLIAAASRTPVAATAIALSVILLYLLPGPLALLGAVPFIALAWLRLDLALLVPVVFCPFYLPVEANPLPAKAFGGLAFPIVELTTAGCAAGWLARYVRPLDSTARPSLPRLVDAGPALLFFTAAAVSSAFADYRGVALREVRTVIAEPIILGLMMLTTFRPRDVGRLVWALVALGAAVSLYSVYHYFVIHIVERTGGVQRVLAVYHSPNQLALLLDRLMPAGLTMLLYSLTAGRRRLLALTVPAFAVMAFTMFITYSRGAWLAVGLGCLVAAACLGWRYAAAIVGLGGVAGAAILGRVNPERLLSEQTSFQRPTLWGAAWSMIRDHPLLGVGPDNFLYYYRDRGYLPPSGWAEPDISHPHNLFLDAWVRTGVAGLAAMVVTLAVFVRNAVRVVGSAETRGSGAWWSGVALLASMAAAMVHGLFDNGYFLIDLAVLFWSSYAAMAVCARPAWPTEDTWTS